MATFRMHFAVPLEDGPIVSLGGPEFPPEIQQLVGERLSAGGTFVVACDPAIIPNEIDRITGDPAHVYCPRCKKTDWFKKAFKPVLSRRDMIKREGVETEDNPL